MLNVKILFGIFFWGLSLTAIPQTGSISSVQVAQRTDGSGYVDIDYNLAGSGPSYIISMEVSFNNGVTYSPIQPAFLSGNIGTVAPGNGLHINWNGKGSNDNTYSSQTIVKLVISNPCGQPVTINHAAGPVAPVNKTVVYGTVTNVPGELAKCWITRNLGASSQPTSVSSSSESPAGWYWQFNRKQGYQHNGTTRVPGSLWITSISEDNNWLPENDPCSLELGNGWRIPTDTEWINVDAAGNWTNWYGPFNSVLRMHAAGYLNPSAGDLYMRGTWGQYWSGVKVNLTVGYNLTFYSTVCKIDGTGKANALSVRCIK